RSNIYTSKSVDEAKKIIEENKVQVLITEYQVEKKDCLPLCDIVISNNKENERFVILVTQNGNQSSVAQALEGDVDGYIIKPFVYNFMKESFEKNILRKLYPSKNQKLLNEAREHIEKKSFYLAEPILMELIKNQSKPSLALYYYGELFQKRGDFDKAKRFWQKSLEVQPGHFKSLNAIYELCLENKEFDEALEYLSKLRSILPLSPGRLKQLFDLYVEGEMYYEVIEAMEDLYNLEDRSLELNQVAAESLLKAGLYFSEAQRVDLAHDAFSKYLMLEAYKISSIEEVIDSLINTEQYKIAEFFLSKVLPDDRASHEFMALDYRVNAGTQGMQYLITRGMELSKAGVNDMHVHKIFIEANISESRIRMAEQALMDAKTKIPEQEDLWVNLESKIVSVSQGEKKDSNKPVMAS
ncbi:MAG: tetratricopeptide repeat protein, partial [Bdellovibrionota bacterium]|nr:tetratricopeptide repeat protein [Bdellovibrionota bacterium]